MLTLIFSKSPGFAGRIAHPPRTKNRDLGFSCWATCYQFSNLLNRCDLGRIRPIFWQRPASATGKPPSISDGTGSKSGYTFRRRYRPVRSHINHARLYPTLQAELVRTGPSQVGRRACHAFRPSLAKKPDREELYKIDSMLRHMGHGRHLAFSGSTIDPPSLSGHPRPASALQRPSHPARCSSRSRFLATREPFP